MTLDDGELAYAVHDLIEARLKSGRSVSLTIVTASMWPVLSPGDRLAIQGAQPEGLRPGDIVVVQAGEIRLAHRLIGRRVERGALLLITKGDNSLTADDPQPASQLIGVAVAIDRRGRRVDLRSSRARAAGATIAVLSQAQGITHRRLSGWPRRVLRKCLALALRLVDSLT